MWYLIRCETIDVILENKDEVMSIVRYERISKVVTAAGGLVGAGMIGIGFLFAFRTMGTSLGLSAVGGVVSTLSAGSSLVSFIASKVTTNNRLKKAQQFVRFDQQFSNQLNAAAAKYSEALETYKEGTLYIALRVVSGVLVGVSVPLDIAQIADNYYQLRKSSNDKTGQSDSDTTIQCLIKQFETSLKGQYAVLSVALSKF